VPPITLDANQSETPQSRWANYVPLVSPNGDWTAYFDFSEIRIAKGESTAWTIPCVLFDGCMYIMPTQWSADSKYLYFGASTYMGGVPLGDEFARFSTAGKINVKTGEWDRLFPDPAYYFDFSVSPDGNYIAFLEQISTEQADNRAVLLNVLDLDNRQRKTYTTDGTEGGNIVWSPYKPRFVFVTRDLYNGSYIVFFDVETEVLRYIMKKEMDRLSIGAWLENNLVLVYRTKQMGKTPSELYLNPFTGEQLPVPPTPTP
jgi:Tol biopolymer transport system component